MIPPIKVKPLWLVLYFADVYDELLNQNHWYANKKSFFSLLTSYVTVKESYNECLMHF